MEKVLLNSSLYEAEANLDKTLKRLRWQGLDLIDYKKHAWGHEAIVAFEDKELTLIEALDGYDLLKVIDPNALYLDFDGYKNSALLKSLSLRTYKLSEEPREYLFLRKHKMLLSSSSFERVDEALGVLKDLEADAVDFKAFCVLQFLKKEETLKEFLDLNPQGLDPRALILAMEARSLYLSFRSHQDLEKIKYVSLSSLAGVNKIVSAEIISQYKQLLNSPKDTPEIRRFYKAWLRKLAPYYQFKIKLREVLEENS